MRSPTILVVVVCWLASMAAVLYASESGASWPLPFALFIMAIGGVVHLAAEMLRGDK